MQENRWATRRPVTVDIELHVGRFPARYIVRCRTKDLSFNGALLRTRNIPAYDDSLASIVFIKGKGSKQQKYPVKARIIRDEKSGIALEFLKLDTETIRYLQHVLYNFDQYRMTLHNITPEPVH